MRRPPRRIRRLDTIYAAEGGTAAAVLTRYRAGETVPAIARELSEKLGEEVATRTVYAWLNEFQGLTQTTEGADEVNQG